MHARLNHPAAALALRIVAAALSFAFGIVAARLLGIESFGVVSVLLGFVNVGVVFSLLGHETLATREVAALSRAGAAAGNATVMAYSRAAARQVWLAGIVTLGAVLLIVLFLPIGEQAGVEFLPLLLLIPLVARTRLSQGLIRGAHRASLSLVPDGIVRPGLAIVALAVLAYAGSKIGYGFAAVMIACAVVGLFAGRTWERHALATVPQATAGGVVSTVAASARHFSTPIFVSSVLAVLVSQIALISTGLLSTSTEAGLYAAAERFSLAAALIGQAVYLAVASRFAALHASGETEHLRTLIRKVTRSVSGATLLVCLGLGLAAGPLLALYGNSFAGAIPVLQVLLISVLCNACAGPTGQVLLMTKHEGDHLTAMLASLVVQAVLIVALVPEHGVLGAAWAVVFSTLVWNGLMMYFVRRRLSINPLLAWA